MRLKHENFNPLSHQTKTKRLTTFLLFIQQDESEQFRKYILNINAMTDYVLIRKKKFLLLSEFIRETIWRFVIFTRSLFQKYSIDKTYRQ